MKIRRLKLTPEQWMRFLVAPLMGIGTNRAIMATTPQYILDKVTRESGMYPLALSLTLCVAASAITVEINIAVSRRLDRYLKWERDPLRRAGTQFLLIFAIMLLLSVVIPKTYFWFFTPPESLRANIPEGSLKNGIIGLMSSLIGTGIYLAISFFQHWNNTRMEAERYKIAAAEAQIEALKAQLDPHFLFNSLNTLTELVEINSSKSLDFLKNFGQVYRYVLQTREHESVTLQEEMDFADSYLFLLKTRFGEALQIEKSVATTDLNKHLPPMALQLLLENAVKHNVLTTAKPLHIRLSSDGQQLKVQNNIQLKSSKAYSAGIGLKNISERVFRLTGQAPVIENSHEFFTVKIPLL